MGCHGRGNVMMADTSSNARHNPILLRLNSNRKGFDPGLPEKAAQGEVSRNALRLDHKGAQHAIVQ